MDDEELFPDFKTIYNEKTFFANCDIKIDLCICSSLFLSDKLSPSSDSLNKCKEPSNKYWGKISKM